MPLTTTTGTARRRAAEMKFGQNSDSTMITSRGSKRAQEPANDERQIERKRHDAMPRVQLARGREAGAGERGNHERRARQVALEERDERLQQRDLARGGAVQPDRAGEPLSEVEPEAHREFAPITCRNEPVQEPGREKDARDQVREIEQQRHRPSCRRRLRHRRIILVEKRSGGSYASAGARQILATDTLLLVAVAA